MKKILLVTSFLMTNVFFLVPVEASVYSPYAICANNDRAGNIEIDSVNSNYGRSQGGYSQLVLRNQNIIQFFLNNGAIFEHEINKKGEFIVTGGGFQNTLFQTQSGNRIIKFIREENGATLEVNLINGTQIANFHFENDCQFN